MAWTRAPRNAGRNVGWRLGNLHIQAAKEREQSVLPRCIPSCGRWNFSVERDLMPKFPFRRSGSLRISLMTSERSVRTSGHWLKDFLTNWPYTESSFVAATGGCRASLGMDGRGRPSLRERENRAHLMSRLGKTGFELGFLAGFLRQVVQAEADTDLLEEVVGRNAAGKDPDVVVRNLAQ
jgi:hypothetical protein